MQHALTGKGATNTGQRYRAVAHAAKQLGMTVDKDEADVFLSHPTFYVEINFDGEDDDVVKDLKITHNRSGEEERDAAVLSDLQNGRMVEFLAGMRRICELHGPDEEEADGKEEPTKFSALCALEADMLAIHAAERSDLSVKELVLQGHGLMQPRLGGQMLRLAYFGSPTLLASVVGGGGAADAGGGGGGGGAAAAAGHGNHSESAWAAAAHALTLGVATLPAASSSAGEMSSRIPLSGRQRFTGKSTKKKEGSDGGGIGRAGFEFDQGEETIPRPPPCIALLQLEKPLATSISTAERLTMIASAGRSATGGGAAAGAGGGLATQDDGWSHLPSVQTLVVGANPRPTKSCGCTYRFAGGQGKGARSSCRGMWLETAQIGRAEQLHSVLQLLRQQQTFNALLKSCTEQSHAANSGDGRSNGGDIACTVEVSSTAPALIQLNTFLPKLSAMLCVEITVGLGGTITCDVSSSAKDPLGDGTGAFERLPNSLSIPTMMQEYLAAVAPQGGAATASKRVASDGAKRGNKRGRNDPA